MEPLTDEERQSWKGWVELESDPSLFNYIIRKYGVQDVKVQEVFGLDDECMAYVPKPIYGMIFLFKYHDDDAENLEDSQKCPKHVWFANQTTNNACATVALLNIVMNIPGLELGDNLQAFKEATQKLKPPYRGKRLSDNDFIRGIHNSFARKIDILNADLLLKHEYEKWKSQAKKENKDEEEGYHFIAYVPVQDEVWRLDGLQREPVKIGDSGDNWIDVASANIMDRALQYQDDGVEYSLMSLCKSPTRLAVEELASNMRLIQALENALSTAIPDWKVFLQTDTAHTVDDLHNIYKLTQELVDSSPPAASELAKISMAGTDPEKLMALYRELVNEQNRLRSVYTQEVSIVGQEDEQAEKKKIDHTHLLYRAMQTLAEAGVLRGIVEDVRGQEAKNKI
ncbi:ubiquitin carboxyl-terminal hydrolase [Cadophora sp. MPI-SDFR-AT-0126]|nr:ubiquitin carboxyl-terminal hydrolase [Leotiomycetes sp. MPI-SDFR-AT-0126]